MPHETVRWTDEFGRTIAVGYSSDTNAGVTNVAWFKALGNGHGHSAASTSTATTKGSKLAIHDTDVVATGTYSGHPSTPSISNPGVQFPGVHSLFQVTLLRLPSQCASELSESLGRMILSSLLSHPTKAFAPLLMEAQAVSSLGWWTSLPR
jgi:hypothetical protein